VHVGFLIHQNVEAACTRAAVTVGVNALLISGKETEIINVSWNVCECEFQIHTMAS
jgi:hypothetical protein